MEKEKIFDRQQLACIGVVLRPHGLQGEVWVRPLAGDGQEAVAQRVIVHAGGALHERQLRRIQRRDGLWRVCLEGVATRQQAEALRGAELLCHPGEEGTSAADTTAAGRPWEALLGYRVENEQGELLGTVQGVFATGANDVLEIAPPDGGEPWLAPWIPQVVRQADAQQRRLILRPLLHSP